MRQCGETRLGSESKPSALPTNRHSGALSIFLPALSSNARGAPGDCIHELRSEEFTAFSGKGIEYENPLVVPPQPELNAKLRSGESFEGWLVFQTSPSEDTALLRFMASVGRAVEQGGQIWFRLY